MAHMTKLAAFAGAATLAAGAAFAADDKDKTRDLADQGYSTTYGEERAEQGYQTQQERQDARAHNQTAGADAREAQMAEADIGINDAAPAQIVEPGTLDVAEGRSPDLDERGMARDQGSAED